MTTSPLLRNDNDEAQITSSGLCQPQRSLIEHFVIHYLRSLDFDPGLYAKLHLVIQFKFREHAFRGWQATEEVRSGYHKTNLKNP